MADRTVKVNLIAVTSGYIAGMDQASKATSALAANSAAKLAAQRQAFTLLGTAALGFGVAVAAATGIAVARAAEFDAAMSNVNAVTEASTAEMQALRDAALEAGGRTVYTAVEAANALEELAKAGLTANQSIDALDGVLDLAASGQLEVSRAAEIAATTLKQFNLGMDESGRVADVLSAGANLALGSVEDLAQGMKFVAPVAAQMGVSLEETTGALALFADKGVLGEQAGTTLRGVLSSLTSPSKAAAQEIERLDINLYDASGSFVGLSNVAGQLNGALADATDAERDFSLGVLFGNQQVTGARILLEAGAETLDRYTEQVDKSGFAAQVAAERLDNLSGDVEKLGGALDTALIQSGSAANETLRGLVQGVTFLVDAIAGAPKPVTDAGFALGVVAAAVSLTSGAAFIAIPRIVEFRNALQVLGVTGRTAAAGIGSATVALTAAVFVLGAVVGYAADSEQAVESFGDSLDEVTGEVTDYTRELIAQRLETEGAIDVGKRLGLSLDDLIDLTLQGKYAVQQWADERRTANAEDAAAVTQYDTVAGALEIVTGQLAEGRDAWQQNRDATEASRRATEENEDALAALEGTAADVGEEIDDLADKIRNFGTAQFDTNAAAREFEASLDDLYAAIEENGAVTDISTEAGRQNMAAVDDLASSTLDYAAAIVEQTGDQEAANAVIAAGRERLVEAMVQLGYSNEAANLYADSLGLIPGNVDTVARLIGADVVERDLNYLARNRFATIYVGSSGVGGGPGIMIPNETGGFYTQGVQAFASGGFPSGMYAGRKGGIHKFAEETLPWETYISPKPGHERENIGYALEALSRLGVDMSGGNGGPNIEITNINPIAQPESESIRQAHQLFTVRVK